eukprot:5535682-Prymnesium_polylepis.1
MRLDGRYGLSANIWTDTFSRSVELLRDSADFRNSSATRAEALSSASSLVTCISTSSSRFSIAMPPSAAPSSSPTAPSRWGAGTRKPAQRLLPACCGGAVPSDAQSVRRHVTGEAT